MAVSVFFVVGALGLLIGPGIGGGATVLGATFAFGGNFGGAKLILVAKETGGLVVVNVLDTSPLVSLAVPLVSLLFSFVVPLVSLVESFVVALLNGFFAGAEVGRVKGLGEVLFKDCLMTGDVRGVVLVFVVGDFVATAVFDVVGVLGDVGVVFVNDTLGVVDVVLAEVVRDEMAVILDAGFGAAFVTDVVFGLEVVFGTVAGRTLEVGLEEDGAVVGLDKDFDAVDKGAFLILEVGFDANGFVVRVVFVEVVLALETVVSNFFGADFFEAKATPVTAAIAAVPAAAATAISET